MNTGTIIKKVHRNDPCPCGKKVNKLYTIEEDNSEQIIPTPVKYKTCCWLKNAGNTKRPHLSHHYKFKAN